MVARSYRRKQRPNLRLVDPLSGASGTPLHPKSIPPFAALRAFEAVGRYGGIRKAASALRLDHAAVSRHLRQLESWLGVPLLDRSMGEVKLNSAGVTYYARVSETLAELASATADLMNRQNEDRGITVWCVPGLAAQWLTSRLVEFRSQWPDCKIELRPTDVAPDPRTREADVDIRFYGDHCRRPPSDRDLKSIEIARPEVFPVAAPGFVRGLPALTGVQDLLALPLLHEQHDDQWRGWFSCNGLIVDRPIAGSLFWHAHLALTAAKQGSGIMLANRYLVGEAVERGELVELKPPGAKRAALGAYLFSARADQWTAPTIAQLRQFLLAKAEESRPGAQLK